jgi:hypothetical protein
LLKDVCEIAWKMYRADGSIAHDSSSLEEAFDFTVGAEPRHVILGWEIAVKSMFEGEVASYVMQPRYAFGEKGLSIFNIEANATLKCDLELVRIKPSVLRSYPSVGMNESIKDELMAKIDSGESVIAEEVMQNKQINATKTDEQRIFFDPAKHKVDPNQRVRGEGRGHIWEETPTAMEVEIPLPLLDGGPFCKQDVRVDIQTGSLTVELLGSAAGVSVQQQSPTATSTSSTVLLGGPLHGKVLPSESMWALLPPDPTAASEYRGQRILVSLEKAHGHKDIWSTVLARSHLGEREIVEGAE